MVELKHWLNFSKVGGETLHFPGDLKNDLV